MAMRKAYQKAARVMLWIVAASLVLSALFVVLSPMARAAASDNSCPDGYRLTGNVWSLKTLPDDLRREAEEHVSAARKRDSAQGTQHEAYQQDDVSRTMGARLRSQVKTRAPVTADITVRYVDSDPETKKLRITELGILHMVNGIGTFVFPDDPRQHIVGTSWPLDFISPTRSRQERRLRVYPGEWQNWCTLNVHGLVP